MTEYTTLTVDTDVRGVARLWMNRPQIHNAMNAQMIVELSSALQQLAQDAAVRVVVLSGQGRSFSAGADVNWMKAAGEASLEENLQDARQLAAMLATLAELPKPTIARVNGAAIGGGMGLACACDICVASDQAVFAVSEVRLGLIPSAISPYVLRALGERQSYRYFLTAEHIRGEAARTLGVAHEVVADAALDDTVNALTEALLQGGPQAQAAGKSLIRAVAHQAVDERIREETARRIAVLRAGEEAQEGLAAFLDKRAAAWTPQA